MPSPFVLTAITRDPALAALCDAAGVDRIGVDIERLGKTSRQGHVPNARISDHELGQLRALGAVVRHATLFARLNPLHDGSGAEIDEALDAGARVLMLPFFRTAGEVERFVRLVDGRASVSLLLETITAAVRLHEVLAVDGIGEIIVGMNDMSLSCGLPDLFELHGSDLLDHLAGLILRSGVPFGFGGLGRAGDNDLPLPSDLVIALHPRVGSTRAWLSRSFFGPDPQAADITAEVAALRARLAYWGEQTPQALLAQRDVLRRRLAALRDAA